VTKTINLKLKVWRQKDSDDKGGFKILTRFTINDMYYLTKNKQIKNRKLVEMNSTLIEQQNQTINPEKLGI